MADEPLPAELCTRPEAFQRERRSIFERAWLLLARADALERPGQYVAQNLGGWPVFAIADASGARRAFRNVCRHQKLPLFDTGAGHCEHIRCRYHGWTYDAAGRFVSAPPPVFPSGELARDLDRVAADELHGFVFVHLDEDPPALAGSLATLAAALAAAKLETLGFRTEISTDIDANWKVVMEQILTDQLPGVMRGVEWPSVILHIGTGGAVLHQVIARSFHRTRIHHHGYGVALEPVAAQIARWKSEAAARQATLEAGGASALPSSPELECFRDRVRAAHREGVA